MVGQQELEGLGICLEIMREVFAFWIRDLILELPQGMDCESKYIPTKPSFI